jgi:hypothetical protein
MIIKDNEEADIKDQIGVLTSCKIKQQTGEKGIDACIEK